MKKILFALASFFPLFLSAQSNQPEQDCLNAIPVCQNTYQQSNAYEGQGANPNEISSGPSCLNSGEKNGVWYVFTIEQTGDLGFLITPNDDTDDYDWAVYNLTNAACSDIFTNVGLEVNCNFSGTAGPTGANNGSQQSSQSAGGTPFNAFIPVEQGQTYVLYISNYSSSQGGYLLDFGLSTATIFDQTPPELDSIVSTIVCNTTALKIQFSENILCNTVQPLDFQLQAPDGTFHTITQTTGTACSGDPQSYDTQFKLTFTPPITQSGTYILKLVGPVTDVCGNVAPFAQKTFEIETVTANAGNDIFICEGDGQALAGNGSGGSILQFEWTPALGLSNPNVQNPIASPSQTTAYYLKVKYQGCESKYDTVVVNVKPKPTMQITGDLEVCPDGGTANVSGTGADAYYWVESGTWSNSTVVTAENGNFTFHVIPYQNDCPGDTVTFTLIPQPSAEITATSNVFCENAANTLTANTTGTGLKYQWQKNGQEIFGAISSVYEAVEPGFYTLIVTKTATGCSAKDTITLFPPPSVVVQAQGETNICLGQNIILSCSENDWNSYQWYKNGELISGATNPIFTATEAGAYVVVVMYSDSCESTSNVISVTSNPTLPAPQTQDAFVCAGDSAMLSATSSLADVVFTWLNAPGGTIVGTAANYLTPPVNQNVTYYVYIIGADGCFSAPVPADVTINGPDAPTTQVQNVICHEGSATILAQSEVSNGVYNWYAAPNAPEALFTGNPFTTPAINAPTDYYVSVSVPGGCESPRVSVTANILNPPPPTVENAEITCYGGASTLTATSFYPNVSFNWYENASGGTPISTGNSFTTPVLTSDAVYYVSLIDEYGCESLGRTPAPITLTPLPVAPTIDAGGVICENQTATLAASGGETGSIYKWYDANDSLLFTGAVYITPVLTQTTSYFVKIIGPDGCESALTETQAVVKKRPYPPFVFIPEPLCQFNEAFIVQAILVENPTYNWYLMLEGGTPFSHDPHFIPQLGVPYYFVSVTDEFGCEGPRNPVFNAQPPPLPNVSATPGVSFCKQGSSLLTAENTGVNGLVYQWFTNADGLGTPIYEGAAFQTPLLDSTAVYYVFSKNTSGCRTGPVQTTITIKDVPTATVFPEGGDTVLCQGESAILNAQTDFGTQFQWFIDGNPISGATEAFYSANVSGVYSVKIKTNDCEADSPPITIAVYPQPEVHIFVEDSITVVCFGKTVKIQSTTENVDFFQWFKDGVEVPGATGATFFANQTGTYQLKVATDKGCTKLSNEIFIKTVVLTLPPINDLSIICGESVQIQPVPIFSDAIYSWTPPENLSAPNISSPFANPIDTKVYTLTVSVGGCLQTTQVKIIVKPLTAEVSFAVIDKCKNSFRLSGASNGVHATYSWEPAAGVDNPTSAWTVAALSGNTSYTLTVSQGGCVSIANPLDVVAFPVVSAGDSLVVCLSGENPDFSSIPLEGAPPGGKWSGVAVFSTSGGFEFRPGLVLHNANFSLTYTYPVFEGCPSQKKVWIYHTYAGKDTVICMKNGVYKPLRNFQTGKWSIPEKPDALLNERDGTTDISALGVGVHQIVFSATGTCSDTFMLTVLDTVKIEAPALPDVISTYTRVPIKNPNDTTNLIFSWDIGLNDGKILHGPAPDFLYTQPGTYEVIMNILNVSGCKSSFIKSVNVTEEELLGVPNAILLSGRPENRVFTIWGPTIYTSFYLEIYNRWGQSIFRSQSLTDFWNGRVENREEYVPEGVYTYRLRLVPINGVSIEKAGTITVLH